MSISRTRITPIIIAVFVSTIGTFISVANTTNATTGDVVASYNFEDGRVPQPGSYAYYANKVAPAVLTDPDGNHFLRMTGSPEDTGNTFHTTPPTIREELLIGETDWSASDSQVVTYCFSMRSPSFNPPQSSTLAQVFLTAAPLQAVHGVSECMRIPVRGASRCGMVVTYLWRRSMTDGIIFLLR